MGNLSSSAEPSSQSETWLYYTFKILVEAATGHEILPQMLREEQEALSKAAVAGRKAAAVPPRLEPQLERLAKEAQVLKELGRQGPAELLLRQALILWEKKAGAWHPDALDTAQHLAELLLAQHIQDAPKLLEPCSSLVGNPHGGEVLLKEAERLLRRVVTGRRAQLGKGHPSSLRSCEGLGQALLLRAQCGGLKAGLRLRQAGALLQRAAQCTEVSRQDRLARGASFARCLQLQGSLKEARALYRSTVPGLCRWASKATTTNHKLQRQSALGASVEGAVMAAYNFASLLGTDVTEAKELRCWSRRTLELLNQEVDQPQAEKREGKTNPMLHSESTTDKSHYDGTQRSREQKKVWNYDGFGSKGHEAQKGEQKCDWPNQIKADEPSTQHEKERDESRKNNPGFSAHAFKGELLVKQGNARKCVIVDAISTNACSERVIPRSKKPLLAAWPNSSQRRAWVGATCQGPQILSCCPMGRYLVLKKLQDAGQDVGEDLSKPPDGFRCTECQ